MEHTRLQPLTTRHRAAIAAHLLRLEPSARYKRFAGMIKDAGIASYVAQMRPLAMMGLWSKGALVGISELHKDGVLRGEIALSLEAPWRGCGWGQQLMDAICEQARVQGLEEVHLVMSSHNPQIVALSRRFAFRPVQRDGGVITASLVLTPV